MMEIIARLADECDHLSAMLRTSQRNLYAVTTAAQALVDAMERGCRICGTDLYLTACRQCDSTDFSAAELIPTLKAALEPKC